MDFTLEVKLPADCVEKLISLSKEHQLSPEAIIRRLVNKAHSDLEVQRTARDSSQWA